PERSVPDVLHLSVGPTLGFPSVRRLRRPSYYPRVPPRQFLFRNGRSFMAIDSVRTCCGAVDAGTSEESCADALLDLVDRVGEVPGSLLAAGEPGHDVELA